MTAVLAGLRQHWPLTLRQVYYQLVSAGVIGNSRNEYQKLSRILSQARQQRIVPWSAIEDRSRSTLEYQDWSDLEAFTSTQVSEFLVGYARDLLQGQESRPEIWVEKDALSHIIHKVSATYCVPVVVARGFASVTFKQQCLERVRHIWNTKGQRTVILYFGDLDPSGWEMPVAMEGYFQDAICRGQLEIRRIALNQEQVEEHDLPTDPDALKDTDTRAAKYRAQFGDIAVELDALDPDTLQELVTTAIEDAIDTDEFERQSEMEDAEQGRLTELRDSVITVVRTAVEAQP